jgi:putative nucleotidyltransferase with HDIG domain
VSAAPVAAPLAALKALTPGTARAWLVGGAVRDELMSRPPAATLDYDLVVDGDARALAKALGRAAGGHPFPLSEEFGAWRVRGREHGWQVDLTPMLGETLEQDLRRRDLTLNAIAREIQGGELIDPCGGVADIGSRTLRAVSADSFSADPLRIVRLARFRAELGFEIDASTETLARASAPALADVPGERVFQEISQLIAADGVLAGLALLQEAGAIEVLLPELHALRGVQQSDFHHLDVYEHTMATLVQVLELERDPEPLFGALAGAKLQTVLAEPLANELTRGQALRIGALLHDIAKPVTRGVTPEGRVTFLDHDSVGASMAVEILGRLRASDRLATHVAALASHHLRLGFLVHQRPLSRRALYRYLHACSPVEVDLTVLSVADRLATLGRNSQVAVAKHLELAREILPAALAYRADPPKPPIRGDRLAFEIGIEPGPRLGELLAELTEATYAGEITTEEEALAYAREQMLTG